MKRPIRKKFYVYEHWRPDKDECFWVGKGNGNRAYSFERNRYYNFIVNKLTALGMCVEVRLVESGLPEHEAFALEKVRIAFWRSRGVQLANLTDGGDGPAGWKPPKGWASRMHTPEAKKKAGAKRRGRKRSPEAVEKGAAKLRGRPLPKRQRELIKETVTHLWQDPVYHAKMSAAHVGKAQTAETRAKQGRRIKQLKWITDGQYNRRIRVDGALPVGWSFGRTFHVIKFKPRSDIGSHHKKRRVLA